jgi:hypothetical protein
VRGSVKNSKNSKIPELIAIAITARQSFRNATALERLCGPLRASPARLRARSRLTPRRALPRAMPPALHVASPPAVWPGRWPTPPPDNEKLSLSPSLGGCCAFVAYIGARSIRLCTWSSLPNAGQSIGCADPFQKHPPTRRAGNVVTAATPTVRNRHGPNCPRHRASRGTWFKSRPSLHEHKFRHESAAMLQKPFCHDRGASAPRRSPGPTAAKCGQLTRTGRDGHRAAAMLQKPFRDDPGAAAPRRSPGPIAARSRPLTRTARGGHRAAAARSKSVS